MNSDDNALNEAVVSAINEISKGEPGRMAKLTILYFQLVLRINGLPIADKDFPEVLRLLANSLEILNEESK